MINRTSTVTLMQFPETFERLTERKFLRDLEPALTLGRPAIVLDCSQVREMNCHAVHLLLCCLEKAMKRNGDVRLAAVSPRAMEDLRMQDVERLFKIFETTESAMDSFERRGMFVTMHAPEESSMASENAA